MKKVQAWVADAPQGELTLKEIELPPLQPGDVEVRIVACGVCASDVTILRSPMAIPPYKFPLVAGHEGTGIVTEVGAAVQHLKVGDRVGCGVYRGNCGTCHGCYHGADNVCQAKMLMFAHGQPGCFAHHVRLSGRFAFRLPDGMDLEVAAPLMCAGLTTFSPFRQHNIKPGDKVGIVGIGGLGHIAVQIGRAYGCEVFAFTTSPGKADDIRRLGAHHVVCSKEGAAGVKTFADVAGKLNYILFTASVHGDVDIKQYVQCLAFGGKLILMGFAMAPSLNVGFADLIMGERSIVGSAAGSSGNCIDMLEFCALHGIKPMTEVFPSSDINAVLTKVAKNEVRFRAVLRFSDA